LKSGFFYAMKSQTHIGNIIKPHGLKGHFMVNFEAIAFASLLKFKAIFIDIDGSKIPFGIEELVELNPGKFRLKLTGINSAGDIERWRGKELFQLTELLGKKRPASALEYEILDANKTVVGTVVEVLDNVMQQLLVVLRDDGSEVFIPFVDEWIIETDEPNKQIIMTLPEGLLDL